jgi:hypothetical protein
MMNGNWGVKLTVHLFNHLLNSIECRKKNNKSGGDNHYTKKRYSTDKRNDVALSFGP